MANELEHNIFGKMQFDSERKNWEGKVCLGSEHFVDVTISIEDCDAKTVFNLVEQTFNHIRGNERAIRNKTAGELLDTHNEVWNEGEAIDANTFSNRIKLEGILFFCDGNAQLYYNDDDLFWGHTIVVGVSNLGNFRDAQIYG